MTEKRKNLLLICLSGAFIIIFSLASILIPDKELSVSERRPLASFPQVDLESIQSGTFMNDFEEYTLDQFPLRDQFRTLKAMVHFYGLGQKDNHGIYAVDGFLSKIEYPMHPTSLDYAAQRFRFVYEKYMKDKEMNVYLSVIPDKNYFMAAANGYLSMDYEAFFHQIQEKTTFARYIDIAPLLTLSDYYHTDSHWRQEKIVDVAGFLSQQMGVSIDDTQYQTHKWDGAFYGVYHGQLALPLPPEDLYYLTNEVIDQYRVYDFETQSMIPVYDLDKANGPDPYELFLAGSKSLLSIENPSASTNQELILFRDSFGSSIAPLLAQGYAKVTVVDIRYISPEYLNNFVTFQDQDVLFLYSCSVLNNSITLK